MNLPAEPDRIAAQTGAGATVKKIAAGVLDMAYYQVGADDGWPVVLLHGFPYDALAFRETAAILADQGAKVIVPWLRGFGETAFLKAETPRSGQQGALGADLVALLDSLGIQRAILGGFDWGGRAACVASLLYPKRVSALVSAMGYNINHIAGSARPAPPEVEHGLWYIWYLQTERGRRGLEADRRKFCRLLWKLWSPTWDFFDEEFEATAQAFDNPDFVEVVVHSYRHRMGTAKGDPAYDSMEAALARMAPINVPSVILHGEADTLSPPPHFGLLEQRFAAAREVRVLENTGHNPPQEDPAGFADAVLAARAMAAAAG